MRTWKKSLIILSLTIMIASFPLFSVAQDPETVNETVINTLLEEFFNNHNLDVAYDLLSPDFVVHDPVHGEMNRDEFIDFFANVFETQPDLSMSDYSLIVGQTMVAQEITLEESTTTQIANLNDGMDSEYGAYETIYNFFGLEDGQVNEAWWIYNDLQLAHFVGVPRSTPELGAPASFSSY